MFSHLKADLPTLSILSLVYLMKGCSRHSAALIRSLQSFFSISLSMSRASWLSPL